MVASDESSSTTTASPSAKESNWLRLLIHPERYRWWHMALFGVAANLVSVPFTARTDWYDEIKRPSFAPPAWVFGPAWAVNCMGVLWLDQQVLNMPDDTPHRKLLLQLQAGNWAIYVTFLPAFFGLRSPVLGAIWTVGMLLLTLVSTVLAGRIERRLIFGLVPQIVWLLLATTLAVYVALKNPDERFGISPQD